MKRKMYIEPGGGLCNRIGVLNYGLILAKEYGYEPVLVWKNNAETACDYEDVFRAPAFEVVNLFYPKEAPKALVKRGHIVKAISNIWTTHRSERYRKGLMKHEIEMHDGDDMPRAEADRVNREAIAAAKEDWIFINTYQCADVDYDYSGIQFQERYHALVQAVIGTDTSHIVGVHIRRTDHRFAIEANPLDNFICKMQAELDADAQVRFYVASDDAQVLSELKDKFGDRVLVNEGAELSRKS